MTETWITGASFFPTLLKANNGTFILQLTASKTLSEQKSNKYSHCWISAIQMFNQRLQQRNVAFSPPWQFHTCSRSQKADSVDICIHINNKIVQYKYKDSCVWDGMCVLEMACVGIRVLCVFVCQCQDRTDGWSYRWGRPSPTSWKSEV